VLSHEYQVMHELELRHWWYRGRRRLILQLLRAHTPVDSLPRILDLGCGTGGNTTAYQVLGTVVGIEPDGNAVALAHARGGAHYCRGGGTALPFSAESFDAVVATDVLEHIADDATAASEVHRVLRPGGVFVLSVPAHPWLYSRHDAALLHHRRYTRDMLVTVLQRAGLEVRWLSYWNATLFPVIAAVRLAGKLRGNSAGHSDTADTPALINEPLAGVLALEAWMLQHIRLPWGVSLVGVASRP
jgi:SAM-dependent methyltransferase